jgi:hypothetical protein
MLLYVETSCTKFRHILFNDYRYEDKVNLMNITDDYNRMLEVLVYQVASNTRTRKNLQVIPKSSFFPL